MLRALLKGLTYYLALFGLLAHVGMLGYAGYIVAQRGYSPSEFLVKAVTWAGLDGRALQAFLYSSPDVADLPQLQVRSARPRILLPELAGVPMAQRAEFWAQRTAIFKKRDWRAGAPCGKGMLRSAACWLTQGDASAAQRAVRAMLKMYVEQPNAAKGYGNGWELGLAYDWVADYPGLGSEQRQQIESKLEEALRGYLLVLNADSASLWHGRASLAANAWVVAVSLGTDTPQRQKLFQDASHHFLVMLEALQLSEAWPEGYNYWINNRAFAIGMAAAAFVNGLEAHALQQDVKSAIRRTALWHVYATRPDHRAEAIGDEGPRVDLGEETARFVDLAASITGDLSLSTYSNYLQSRHKARAYYHGYRWWYQLLMPEQGLPITDQAAPLAVFDGLLPTAQMFGPEGMAQAYLRSDWGADSTYIAYRAGATMTHHGHYDAGHFTLFKRAPLAMNSGTYGQYMSPHRLNYAIRSVAKNTLLIMRPDETVKPNRFFTENVAAGGQRITLPTGSAIKSVADWRENLYAGQHLAAGKTEAYEHKADAYTYIASDLTAAYNNPRHDEGGAGGKVERVRRSLVYVRELDQLVVYDRVQTTDAAFVPKWLLHTASKPSASGLKVLKGQSDNGILETAATSWQVENAEAPMRVQTLLPKAARTLLIGGKDYRYYVDIDGDAATLDGQNMDDGEHRAKWFEQAGWRLEVAAAMPSQSQRFLHVLSPGVDTDAPSVSGLLSDVPEDLPHVRLGKQVLVFVDRGERSTLRLSVPAGVEKVRLFGLPEWRDVQSQGSPAPRTYRASEAGTLSLDVVPGDSLHLAW